MRQQETLVARSSRLTDLNMHSRDEFSALYQGSVREVLALMPSDWSALAKHNAGWRKGRFDAAQYLKSSEVRYWHAYRALAESGSSRVLDVGGFLGAFPLVLGTLGFSVSVAEKFGYYGNAMDEIAAHLVKSGIEVIDADFTQASTVPEALLERFHGATCMALAEHLAHSPKALMDNVHSVLRQGGTFVFEVPNIAYWPKRFAFFFRGQTVLAPIDEVYDSAIPFTGHHREYTLSDARYVVSQGGFEIVRQQTFNYGVETGNPLVLLKYLPAYLFNEWAEVIMLNCKKVRGAR